MRSITSWVLGLVVAAPALAADKDIVETAVSAGNHSTLVRALSAAGLADTLKGPGPFTVFAPTDEAFAKLPSGTMDDLLRPENKQRLTQILNNHVIQGKYLSPDLTRLDGRSMSTRQGSTLPITASAGSFRVANASVVQPDIETTNGVIHSIDTVMMPPRSTTDTSVVPTAAYRADITTAPPTAPLAAPATPTTAPVAGFTTTAPVQPYTVYRPLPTTMPATPFTTPPPGFTASAPGGPGTVYPSTLPTQPYYTNMPTVQRRRGLGGLLRRLNPFARRYR
jgi:uncharacterized surface protein with fasciclin (FAS1) repeats